MRVKKTAPVYGCVYGFAAICVSELFLAMLAAWAVWAGVLPTGSMPWLACGITAVSAALGALVCGKRVAGKRFLFCLFTCIAFLLVIFVVRGLVWKTVAEQPWMILAPALIGCILGCVLSVKGKQRRY